MWTLQDFVDDFQMKPNKNQCKLNFCEISMSTGPEIANLVIEKISNTIRRLGCNIIVERGYIDLSVSYTVSLPDSNFIPNSEKFKMTLASTLIESKEHLAKMTISKFADSIRRLGLNIIVDGDYTSGPSYLFTVTLPNKV
jgi:hypothetical protein